MRLDMNIFQIAAKYATNLMGIATPEEREALENWKQESVWHTNLAERLDQEEDFKAVVGTFFCYRGLEKNGEESG